MKSFSCDGCHTNVANPVVMGLIVKREYCEACVPLAEKFIEEEEQLRKVTHERFAAEREAIVARFSDGGFLLPDIA